MDSILHKIGEVIGFRPRQKLEGVTFSHGKLKGFLIQGTPGDVIAEYFHDWGACISLEEITALVEAGGDDE